MSHLSWENEVSPAVEQVARCYFRGDPEQEEKTADAVSLAWEALQTAPPEATAWSIAEFAVLGVKSGRQFSRSRRSIDSPLRSFEGKRRRFDPGAVTRPGDNPADIAVVTMDVPAWLASLDSQRRTVATELAAGTRTGEVAEMIGRTPGRVSQYRRELAVSWADFTA